MRLKEHNILNNIFVILLFLLLLCGCGRKQKNIFLFEEQELPRINKLSLPSVRGVQAKKTHCGNLISWFAVEIPLTPYTTKPYLSSKYFAGYNVYRLVRINIIPKQPCNKHPLKSTTLLDREKVKTNKSLYYLVRAVFIYNNSTSEGPLSHIVRLSD